MPSIDLSAFKPVSGTDSDAALIDNAFDVLQTAINGGLDNNNIAAGAGIVASKLALTYTDYVPTWSASGTAVALNNGTNVGRFAQVGKHVHAYGKLTMGSTTTFGTGTYSFALPVNASANVQGTITSIGDVYALDNSALAFLRAAAIASTASTITIQYPNAYPTGTQVIVATTVPWTWASADTITFNLLYEAA